MSVQPKGVAQFGAADVKDVPLPPDWRAGLQASIKRFERPIRLCCPCIGLNAAGRALRQLAIEYKLVNSCDIEEHLRDVLFSHESDVSGLRLGHVEWYIMQMELGSLDPADCLLAGPPCPPFSSNGNRNPAADPRVWIFYQVLLFIVYLVPKGLVYALVENVLGCDMKLNGGEESFLDVALDFVRKHCPDMVWRTDVLDTREYGLAQSRRRVFLQGLRHLDQFRSKPSNIQFVWRILKSNIISIALYG